jgi:hypothetical protein
LQGIEYRHDIGRGNHGVALEAAANDHVNPGLVCGTSYPSVSPYLLHMQSKTGRPGSNESGAS